MSWTEVKPTGVTMNLKKFDIEGVAFASPTSGVFVRQRKDTTTDTAAAFLYSPATNTWSDISPSTTLGLDILTDVAIVGSAARAVGNGDDSSGDRQGMVLSSTGSAFTQVTAFGTAPECKVGESTNQVEVLTEVEMLSTSSIWVAGQCGRVWRYNGTSWTQKKSQTDSHVQGLSARAGGVCYIATHRDSNTQSSVTRAGGN